MALIENPYPNSWYVCRWSDAVKDWCPLLDSVGNKLYAMGYLNGVDSFAPHNGYRLIDKDGSLYEERKPKGRMQLNVAAKAAEPAAREAGRGQG